MDSEETIQGNSVLDLFLVKLAGKYLKCDPGHVIYSEGDMGNTMLLILLGDVNIVKLCSETNEPVTIATRSAGEFIGEMALVEESPRSASVIAKTACKVLEITKGNFEKIIKEKPSFALDVLESLSNKLRESDSSRVAELERNNLDLTAANEELRGLNLFLDSIIDQSPSAIFLVTESGGISKMNRSAYGIFRLEKGQDYNIKDLFRNFKFAEAQQDLQTTWSGDVKGRRAGGEFPAFVTCTVLSSYQEELLYLIMGQDLTEISGFASIRATEDRHVSARQSAHELAQQFAAEVDTLQGYLDQLSDGLSDKNATTVEYSHKLVVDAVSSLGDDARHIVESNKMESHFAFVEIRILLKTILKYWQATNGYANISYNLEVSKSVPVRVHVDEVAIQNVLISLMSAEKQAASRVSKSDKYKLEVDLCRSQDNRFSEIRIVTPLANLELDDIITELNRHNIFDWNYIEQVIHRHEGEFTITNNDDNYPVIIIRLP
jgi:PAS domain-containing protein